MFENCMNFTVGAVLTVIAWCSAIAMVLGGTLLEVDWVARSGLAVTIIAAVLTVLQDNAKTRRVVRAVSRETHVRSI